MNNLVLRPQSFGELTQFATMASKSAMVPQSFRGKPEDIMLAIQMGSELGLAPMQALQNIAVINGRPSVWGDALIGLCRASPQCEDIEETVAGEGDAMTATCVATRRGSSPVISAFSVADAKKAGLWGKTGPWTQYPKRMLQQRARGFALRDAFPDVLRGLWTAEEAADIAPPHAGVTIEAAAEPQTRETINQETAPKKQTTREWLDRLTMDLDNAATSHEVDGIIAREDVQNALDTLRNGARDRLNAMVKAALDRTAAEEGAAHEPEGVE